MNTLEKLHRNGININLKDLQETIDKFGITEISVFGSVLTGNFKASSDIDLLIVFKNSENISLVDILEIQGTMGKLMGRFVDVVEPAGLVNPYRRKTILETKELIYGT